MKDYETRYEHRLRLREGRVIYMPKHLLKSQGHRYTYRYPMKKFNTIIFLIDKAHASNFHTLLLLFFRTFQNLKEVIVYISVPLRLFLFFLEVGKIGLSEE